MSKPFGSSGELSFGPLRGIKIVEFAGMGPGPFAAMLLSDMGADIIRIERPDAPDELVSPIADRGRRRVRADLKKPEDLAHIFALLNEADALIEGYRPGVMERAGLGPDEVLRRNPRLVYGRITGWGQTGPLAKVAGHDINYIAITGALSAIGPKAQPMPPLNLVGDFGGGALYLAMGILAALVEARATDKGQVVDCAMCDGAISLMTAIYEKTSLGEWTEDREANIFDGGAPFYRTFECADGLYVSIGALEPKFYELLCESIGLTERLSADERDDPANWPKLHAQLAAIFKRKTRGEWTRQLEGTDACFAPVLSLSEAPLHPHLQARQSFVTRKGVVQPAPAPRFSRSVTSVREVDPTPVPISSLLADIAS
jgi:alpha-methylacyl-CoA racemase